jgi:hypothetical protein
VAGGYNPVVADEWWDVGGEFPKAPSRAVVGIGDGCQMASERVLNDRRRTRILDEPTETDEKGKPE